jgi:hypothetical protein
LTWEIEHVVKTPRQRSLRKKVPARIRVVNKLEEGSQQAPDISFGGVFEIEVIVRDQRCSRFSNMLDFLEGFSLKT